MPTFYEATDIEEAYLKPLRSVLLIDDQFPRYEQLLSGDPEKGNFDLETVGKLFALCRDRGLMCDVENRAADLTDQRMDHLGKSDLIVLDYHLGAEERRRSGTGASNLEASRLQPTCEPCRCLHEFARP